jgi:hypothetical protein
MLFFISPYNKMATFTHNTFVKHDDYMTPKSAWDDIKQFIPKDRVIWEAFYGDGKSGMYLRDLGFKVIHEDVDFFVEDRGDIIVSNPPFSIAKEVMERLHVLDKPFILILPSSKINTSYFRHWKNRLQIIIPKKRIPFEKQVGGVVPKNWKSSPNFDTFYYCYKIGLAKDITWLD